jgi:hypothetical protein
MAEDDPQIPPDRALELISEQIESEHRLISNRLSWYVTSQSFLLTAFAAWAWQQLKPQWGCIPARGMPILGIATSFAIIPTLLGATITMQKWYTLLRKYVPKTTPLGRLIYLHRGAWIHWSGLIVPNLFPFFFLALWFFILLR